MLGGWLLGTIRDTVNRGWLDNEAKESFPEFPDSKDKQWYCQLAKWISNGVKADLNGRVLGQHNRSAN